MQSILITLVFYRVSSARIVATTHTRSARRRFPETARARSPPTCWWISRATRRRTTPSTETETPTTNPGTLPTRRTQARPGTMEELAPPISTRRWELAWFACSKCRVLFPTRLDFWFCKGKAIRFGVSELNHFRPPFEAIDLYKAWSGSSLIFSFHLCTYFWCSLQLHGNLAGKSELIIVFAGLMS